VDERLGLAPGNGLLGVWRRGPVRTVKGGCCRQGSSELAEGQTTKAIALVLKISDKTVEYHRADLMALLNIFDIPGLGRFPRRRRQFTMGQQLRPTG
jgi:hypothetical protein